MELVPVNPYANQQDWDEEYIEAPSVLNPQQQPAAQHTSGEHHADPEDPVGRPASVFETLMGLFSGKKNTSAPHAKNSEPRLHWMHVDLIVVNVLSHISDSRTLSAFNLASRQIARAMAQDGWWRELCFNHFNLRCKPQKHSSWKSLYATCNRAIRGEPWGVVPNDGRLFAERFGYVYDLAIRGNLLSGGNKRVTNPPYIRMSTVVPFAQGESPFVGGRMPELWQNTDGSVGEGAGLNCFRLRGGNGLPFTSAPFVVPGRNNEISAAEARLQRFSVYDFYEAQHVDVDGDGDDLSRLPPTWRQDLDPSTLSVLCLDRPEHIFFGVVAPEFRDPTLATMHGNHHLFDCIPFNLPNSVITIQCRSVVDAFGDSKNTFYVYKHTAVGVECVAEHDISGLGDTVFFAVALAAPGATCAII